MEHYLENPHFWTSLALVLLLALIGRKLWAALTGMLDARTSMIKDQIEEAQRLRDEAQALLEEYQRKHREALGEAKDIVTQAKDLSINQIKEAKKSLENSLNRRTKAAMEKIAQAEIAAMNEVRAETVRLAIAAAGSIIQGQMNSTRSSQLIDQAIRELPQKLH